MKFLPTTVTVFILTIAAVKGQTTINIANYPPVNAVPPVNSAQVQAWLKEIDLTGAPAIPKTSAPKGSPPTCVSPPIANSCVWTCDACASDDITSCAVPNTWGLTFDDGPSTFTPTLLDYLKTNKLSASFFLIGSNVIQHPDIVKREVDEGHHLASHTWSHTALTSLSNEEIVAEMKWTEKAVLDATGLRMKYMRPPYGDINNRVRFVLKKLGYIPVDWTGDQFDTNDWRIGTTGWTETVVVNTFAKNLDTYVASAKNSGFYCLEHDVSANTVNVALKLLPLGITRKINFASVAGCQSDASPYQLGGTAPMPSLPGSTNTTSTVKPPAGGATGTAGGASPTTGGTGPSVISKNAGAQQLTSASVISAMAMVVVGVLLA